MAMNTEAKCYLQDARFVLLLINGWQVGRTTIISTAIGSKRSRAVVTHSVYKIYLRYSGHRFFRTGDPPPISTSCAHTAVATQFLWSASSYGRLS
jgi:hypothetical protein